MSEQFTTEEKKLASRHLIRSFWTGAIVFEFTALALMWLAFYLATKVPNWAVPPLTITAFVFIITFAGFGIACVACAADERERAKKIT